MFGEKGAKLLQQLQDASQLPINDCTNLKSLYYEQSEANDDTILALQGFAESPFDSEFSFDDSLVLRVEQLEFVPNFST